MDGIRDVDPVSGHIFAWPILTDGLKQDHPEWFEPEQEPTEEELAEQQEGCDCGNPWCSECGYQ